MSKSTPQNLYVAKDFDSLSALIDSKNFEKIKLTIENVDKTGMNLFSKANETLKNGDEEKSFIYFMRFLRLMLTFQDKHKSDSKKLKCLQKINYVLEITDKIKESLTKRYEELNKPKEVIEKIEQEIPEPENELEIFLKQNCDFIKCRDLYKYSTEYNGKFLILDIRESEDFIKSHIDMAPLNVCNISNILEQGLSANQLGKQLKDSHAKELWDKRNSFDLIILLGWKSDEHLIKILLEILLNWDNFKYQHIPRILEGGYSEWLIQYPNKSTNPLIENKYNLNPSEFDIHLEPLEYPDLSNGPPLIDRTSKPSSTIKINDLDEPSIHVNKMNEKNKLNNETNINKPKKTIQHKENILPSSSVNEKITSPIIVTPKPHSPLKPTTHKGKTNSNLIPPRELKPNNQQSQLKRAYSSPNIQELQDIPKTPTYTPEIDRTKKHMFTSSKIRNFSPVERTRGHGLTGLKNLGNTCYMNSILQCLNNIKPLSRYFCDNKFHYDLNRSTKNDVAHEVAAVFSHMNYSYRSISIKDLRNLVGKLRKQFATNEQQDSHEFFTMLMDWLQEDFLKPIKSEPDKDLENKTNSPELQWQQFKKRNNSFIAELFYGQQRSTVKCIKCKEESITYDVFSNLSVPLPVHNNCSIKDCLALYLSGEEKIHGWQCPKCKMPRIATKRFDICRLPPVLVIHLNRFHIDEGICRKRQTLVNFPLENFEMTIPITGGKKIYDLYSVSNHYGTMEGGHYTAYCRNSSLNQWFCFDDHEVREINDSDVQTQAAYILFYCAIDLNVQFKNIIVN